MLLNLLNELGKSDKMSGLSSNLSFFRNEFDKFNNTGARMLDFIYHMILCTNKDRLPFWHEHVNILPSFTQSYNGRHNVSRKSVNH